MSRARHPARASGEDDGRREHGHSRRHSEGAKWWEDPAAQPSDAGRSARTLWKPSRTGQTIAPLQVGALLVPVEAPRDEVIVEVVVLEGAFWRRDLRLSDIASGGLTMDINLNADLAEGYRP